MAEREPVFDANDEDGVTLADLEGLSPPHRTLIEARAAWIETARPKQLPPEPPWFIWALIAGRFFGKTRPAAEECWYAAAANPGWRIAAVAPTQNDIRRVIFEGESGLLARTPAAVLRGGSIGKAYNRSFAELYFENGSRIEGYSAEKPNRLRGPQFQMAWCDELAAWANGQPEEAWNNLMFGLRLPPRPRVIVTTTPRPLPLIRKIVKDKRAVIVRGSSYENRDNIASEALETISAYEGTKYGKQEIHGEILDESEGAIFARSWFRLWPARRELPVFSYIVLSIDGAFSEKETADNSACSAWGTFRLARKTERGVWLPSKPCLMLLDLWGEKLRMPDLVEKARGSMSASYGGSSKILPHGQVIEGLPGRSPDLALIENKASGISLGQLLENDDLPVEYWDPGRMDKAMRAHSVSDLALKGHVWVPESLARPGEPVDWAMPMIDQACTFTGDKTSIPHDDEMDTLTQVLAWARDSGQLTPQPMGEAGASAADDAAARDPRLWAAVEDGDVGYGVRRYRPAGNGRNPYDS